MVDSNIRIELIKQKDLFDFSRKVQTVPVFSDVCPITPMRATSQARNPYAQAEDVVLLLAYQGEKCIGYHGLLPGRLISGGRPSPVFWVTTFYIAPAFRNLGIGRMLLEEIKRLKIDFITTQMTPSAERAYRRSGYLDLGHLDYCQLRLDRLTPHRFQAVSHTGRRTPAQRFFEQFYRFRKHLFYRKVIRPINSGSLILRQIDRISKISKESICTHDADPVFHRGIEIVNWMIENPWVRDGNVNNGKYRNYYFTSSLEFFQYKTIEILDPAQNGPLGFVVLSASKKRGRSRIKVLDHCDPNATGRRWIAAAALQNAAQVLADRIEFPSALREDFEKLTQTQRLIKKQRRIYLYTPAHPESHLADAAGHLTFNYCDGDTPFT